MRKSLVFLGTSGLKTRPAASLSGAGWAAACRERRIGDCKIGAGQGRGHVNHTAAPSRLAARVHHGHGQGREVAAAKGGSAGDHTWQNRKGRGTCDGSFIFQVRGNTIVHKSAQLGNGFLGSRRVSYCGRLPGRRLPGRR